MTEGPIRRRVVARGRVQGVFFRDSVRRRAEEVGVAGWIRNRDDGAVEGAFEGVPETVEAMVSYCRSGPGNASVDSLEVTEEEPRGTKGFAVEP